MTRNITLLSANLGSPDEHVKKDIERTLRLKFSYVNEIQESGRKRSSVQAQLIIMNVFRCSNELM